MTTRQTLYIHLLKRPIGFLGALVGLILLSLIFIGTMILLHFADRHTPVGRIVRSTSIDELPQLINILKGDMAFIGLRPLLVQYLPLYSPEQARRHEVRPGISGWAQCHGRNAIS